MAAHQLGGVGVALLRHDRRAGRPLVGQRDEAERLRRPDDEFLGEPRQMQAHLRRCHQIIEREIAIRYRSEEGRVGKEWVSTGRFRWSPYHKKKNKNKKKIHIEQIT